MDSMNMKNLNMKKYGSRPEGSRPLLPSVPKTARTCSHIGFSAATTGTV
jgi:hypothetical protein